MFRKFLISIGLMMSFFLSSHASAAYSAVSCIMLADSAPPPVGPPPYPPAPTMCNESVLPTLETGQFSMQGYYIWPVASGTTGWLTLHHIATGVNTYHPLVATSGSGVGSGTVDPGNSANFGNWSWTGVIIVGADYIRITLKMYDMPGVPDYWETCAINITQGMYVYPCEYWG